MTPRQIHALEWAVEYVGDLLQEMGQRPEREAKWIEARRALAAAWSEYRATRIARRTAPSKRDLQRVRAK